MIVLRWMICTNLNILYLQRWMYFDFVERFALLLNDLEGSIKLSPGNYPLENCLGIFPSMKISLMNIAPEKPPFVETPSVTIALQQMKKQTIFKI